jgi:hypothetical protein
LSISKINAHQMLTLLIASNIILDIIAVTLWGVFPATQWSIYRLGFPVVGTEAIIAAVLFTITLAGLRKKRKWAPKLAIAITVTQRIFGTYVFFPSYAIFITLTWSLIIIFFAYKEIKTNQAA